MRIFVDTSAIFAALVRTDLNHEPARRTLELLIRSGAELSTTSYGLLETLALLQARSGLETAFQFEHELRPLLQILWVDEALHDRAFRRLELRNRRDLSLVDCAAFIAVEELGHEAAFAYDSHFADEGFRLIQRPEDLPRHA